MRVGVVLLSAGSGSRMNTDMPKQYMMIEGHPVLYYSLYEFEKCPYERYNSVYNGLKLIKDNEYVMIHDGARPCIDGVLIERLIKAVIEDDAVIPAVSSKDTIKIADDNGYVVSTPKRDNVWSVQTPQTFRLKPLWDAFDRYMSADDMAGVTDDAMVWEMYNEKPVRIVAGEYSNIKLTTPEDVEPIKMFLGNKIRNL